MVEEARLEILFSSWTSWATFSPHPAGSREVEVRSLGRGEGSTQVTAERWCDARLPQGSTSIRVQNYTIQAEKLQSKRKKKLEVSSEKPNHFHLK